MVLLVSSIAGLPPILVFLATGSHGLIGIGIHDDGINTGTGPAIFQFMGLMGEVQLPNAGILRKEQSPYSKLQVLPLRSAFYL